MILRRTTVAEPQHVAPYDDRFTAGYRAGFEAGKAAAYRDSTHITDSLNALAAEPAVQRAPRVTGPKCVDCGHAYTTHNELGYCQAKGKAGSDGCHCEYAMDAEQRARIDARHSEVKPTSTSLEP